MSTGDSGSASFGDWDALNSLDFPLPHVTDAPEPKPEPRKPIVSLTVKSASSEDSIAKLPPIQFNSPKKLSVIDFSAISTATKLSASLMLPIHSDSHPQPVPAHPEEEERPPPFSDIDFNKSPPSPQELALSEKEGTSTEPSDEFALPDSPATSQRSEPNRDETTARSDVKTSNLTQATMNPIDIIIPPRPGPLPSDIRLSSVTQEVYSEAPAIKQNPLLFGIGDAFDRSTAKFHRQFQRELEVLLTSPVVSPANGILAAFGSSLTDQMQREIEQAFEDQESPAEAPKSGNRALGVTGAFDNAHRDLREQLAAAVGNADRREEHFMQNLMDLQAQVADTDRRWKGGMSQLIGALALGATNLSCLRKRRIAENRQRQDVMRQLSLTRLKLEAQLNRHFHDREAFDREAFVFELVKRESDYYSIDIPADKAPEHEAIVHELMLIEMAIGEDVYQGVVEKAAGELEREKRHLAQSLAAIEKWTFMAQATPKKAEAEEEPS
jgi:hypothetical protein